MVYLISTMRDEFSTLDIVKALKIPRERIRDWMNRGFVTATVSAEGQGTKAIFTRDDVYGVALFRRLVDYGFSREVAGNFVRAFADQIKKESGRSEYPETFYIMFREPGTSDLSDVMRLGPGEWKVDVENAYIDWPASNPELKEFYERDRIDHPEGHVKDKNWKVLLIVNFEYLRREVDLALENI
jgi:hypothetical protein